MEMKFLGVGRTGMVSNEGAMYLGSINKFGRNNNDQGIKVE
jgi:hypothetical protein